MAHESYSRLCPQADTAFLFIHGILGSPDHFRELTPLVPESCSLVNLLLSGHGGSPRDFSATSMERWRSQVSDATGQLLATHRRVYIVAHSMGTLLAMEQAVAHPEQIKALFLIAPPLKVRVMPTIVINGTRVLLGKVDHSDPWSVATRDACSLQLNFRFWEYTGWIRRFLELFSRIHDTRQLLHRVAVPCRAYISHKDELVSPESARYLTAIPGVQIRYLSKSGHLYYEPEELSFLKEEFTALVNQAMQEGA